MSDNASYSDLTVHLGASVLHGERVTHPLVHVEQDVDDFARVLQLRIVGHAQRM